MDTLFLTINSTYTTLTVAFCKHENVVASITESHRHASTHMLLMIDEVLKKNMATLNDLSYIAVNAGPGPFTTLRTVIATSNGLGYATGLPLIAVNGIAAFVKEHRQPEFTHTFALLDAFCSDVYFAYYNHAKEVIKDGSCSITTWIEHLRHFLIENPHARIKFIGNALSLHQAKIIDAFGTGFIAFEAVPDYPSIDAIKNAACIAWNNQQVTQQVIPLYLKEFMVQ